MTLQILHPAIQHHLRRSLKWLDLWPLQRRAAEPVLDGEDVLIAAAPGEGKLEAVFFPLLSRMLSEAWTGTSTLLLGAHSSPEALERIVDRFEIIGDCVGRSIGCAAPGAEQPRSDVILLSRRQWAASFSGVDPTLPGSIPDLRVLMIEDFESFAEGDGAAARMTWVEDLEAACSHRLQRIGFTGSTADTDRLLLALSPAGRPGVTVTASG